VFPSRVEAAYGKSKWVNWCYVEADTTKTFLVAVIIPEESVLAQFAKENRLAGTTIAEWVKNPKVKEAVQKDFNKVASKASLQPHERIRDFLLDSINFSVENDLLTPEFLLVRPKIRTFYASQIADLSLRAEGVSPPAAISPPQAEVVAAALPSQPEVAAPVPPPQAQEAPKPQPLTEPQPSELRSQSQPLPLTSALPTSAEVIQQSTSAEVVRTPPPPVTQEQGSQPPELAVADLPSSEMPPPKDAGKPSLTVSTTTSTTAGDEQPQAKSSLSPISG